MNDNKELLKLLYDYAHAIAINAAVIKKGRGNRFSKYANFNYDKLRHRNLTNGYKFYLSDQPEDKHWIKLTNISPVKLIKSINHEPQLTNSKVTDVYENTISNNSASIDLESSYTYKATDTTTVDEDYGLAIAATISNTFTAGNDNTAVKNETTFSTTVNTSYHKGVGHTVDNSRTITNKITVPPMSKVVVSAETKSSNYKQKQEYFSGIEFEVEIYSHRDFLAKWDSFEEFRQSANGDGPVDASGDAGEINKDWSDNKSPFYARRWLDNFGNASVHYTAEVTFDKAVTGEASITEVKLGG